MGIGLGQSQVHSRGNLDPGMSFPALLGYAQGVSDQTISVSPTVLTGLSVTVTIPASRRIRIKVHQVVTNGSGVASWSVLSILEDGVSIKDSVGSHAASGSAIYYTHETSIIKTPSAGTHTYTVTLQISAANMTAENAGIRFGYISVEDITGVAVAAQPTSVPVGLLAQTQRNSNIVTSGTTPLDTLTTNIVVPAGRTLSINWYEPNVFGTAAADVFDLLIMRDGVQIQAGQQDIPAGNDNLRSPHIVFLDSPSAGAHTYFARIVRAAGSGTLTLQGASNFPALLWVEDITPTPAPTNQQPSSTLGYAEVVADQGGITTEVDLIGLTTSVTVAAGRRVRITGYTDVRSTVANDALRLALKEGTTVFNIGRVHTGVASQSDQIVVHHVLTPSAGTHTYKLTLMREAGTGTLTSQATVAAPAFILVEDITGVSTALDIPTGLWAPSNEFPSNPGHGDLFYERDTDKLWAWNGTAWVQLIASGAWTAYTPSDTNVTVGNGTRRARWTRMGRTIHVMWTLNFGSTTALTGNVSIGLPVVSSSAGVYAGPIHTHDSGVQFGVGVCTTTSAASANLYCADAAGPRTINATLPHTWGTGDDLTVSLTYEADTN